MKKVLKVLGIIGLVFGIAASYIGATMTDEELKRRLIERNPETKDLLDEDGMEFTRNIIVPVWFGMWFIAWPVLLPYNVYLLFKK